MYYTPNGLSADFMLGVVRRRLLSAKERIHLAGSLRPLVVRIYIYAHIPDENGFKYIDAHVTDAQSPRRILQTKRSTAAPCKRAVYGFTYRFFIFASNVYSVCGRKKNK